MMRISGILAALAAVALNGCAAFAPDRIHYRWAEENTAPCATCAPPASEDFFGVAISGGGSRAAVFGAAALEALAAKGVLKDVTHLSSVSGGSFAASYYALKKPSTPAEFAEFRSVMRKNFFFQMEKRQVFKPGRWLSSTRRLISLGNTLDDAFLNDATFADLAPSPVLILNAARYDDGRRFIFSNLALPDEDPGFEPYSEETLRAASFSRHGCEHAAPGAFPLSLAVASSAAFPLLFGPAAFEMPANCAGGGPIYWHLGDGGVVDNTGADTLEELVMRAFKKGEITKALILSIDAGRRSGAEEMMAQRDLRLWTRDPGRIVDVATMRAEAYRELVRRHARAVRDADFEVVTLRYTDAKIEDWPSSCDEGDRKKPVRERLALIPTALDISDCDADLMEAAARWLIDDWWQKRESGAAATEPMAE
jgi:predicted acylesterase/phospholipase RssA